MKFRLEDLPPALRKKLDPELVSPETPGCIRNAKVAKYRNRPTEVDGIRFDSKKEAERYRQLKALEEAGKVQNLKLQPRYELLGPEGPLRSESGRILKYVADFEYIDITGRIGYLVIEDVKSKATLTPVYKLKRAIMRNMGYVIREV